MKAAKVETELAGKDTVTTVAAAAAATAGTATAAVSTSSPNSVTKNDKTNFHQTEDETGIMSAQSQEAVTKAARARSTYVGTVNSALADSDAISTEFISDAMFPTSVIVGSVVNFDISQDSVMEAKGSFAAAANKGTNFSLVGVLFDVDEKLNQAIFADVVAIPTNSNKSLKVKMQILLHNPKSLAVPASSLASEVEERRFKLRNYGIKTIYLTDSEGRILWYVPSYYVHIFL